jgi:hypothetical protein
MFLFLPQPFSLFPLTWEEESQFFSNTLLRKKKVVLLIGNFFLLTGNGEIKDCKINEIAGKKFVRMQIQLKTPNPKKLDKVDITSTANLLPNY